MTDSTILLAVFGLVFIINLTACPTSKPSDNNDDAAGETGPAECVDEDKRIAELEAAKAKLEAELAACAPTPEPK